MRDPVIQILVAAHKKTCAPQNRCIRLIQVGTALAAERLPGMLHDNVGENISRKNRSYCELTAQYFAWKNLEADYYGFFHYRRYMNFAKEYPPMAAMDLKTDSRQSGIIKRFKKRYPVPYIRSDSLYNHGADDTLDEEHILAVVQKYDVITVLGERMNVTVYEQFCQFHDKQDLDRMISILKKCQPEFAAACDAYMDSKTIYFCNMYIMKREYFIEYMEWLFPLLEEFEAGKDFSGCSRKQIRITGYLAERLFGVYYTWLGQQGKAKRCELQYMIFGKGPDVRRFCLWEGRWELVLDMRKVNRVLPAGSLRRRLLRTLAGRLLS